MFDPSLLAGFYLLISECHFIIASSLARLKRLPHQFNPSVLDFITAPIVNYDALNLMHRKVINEETAKESFDFESAKHVLVDLPLDELFEALKEMVEKLLGLSDRLSPAPLFVMDLEDQYRGVSVIALPFILRQDGKPYLILEIAHFGKTYIFRATEDESFWDGVQGAGFLTGSEITCLLSAISERFPNHPAQVKASFPSIDASLFTAKSEMKRLFTVELSQLAAKCMHFAFINGIKLGKSHTTLECLSSLTEASMRSSQF